MRNVLASAFLCITLAASAQDSKKDSTNLDYGFRTYDARAGRYMGIDPKALHNKPHNLADAVNLKWKTGELSFEYNGQIYDAIVVNPKLQKIKMHWLSKESTPYKNINSVKQDLQKNNNDILMITNGGMYLKNNIPQGLFISDGKELRPIDSIRNNEGNFYMQPNGVLFTNSTGAYILATNNFIDTVKNKKLKISYATQSGPMLINKGKINAFFTPQSKNLNLRSGVGILPNGHVIFIISRSDKTNFYDFASIFKNKFQCKNALYLDGAISKMYLKTLRKDDLGGSFGAIISVTE